MALTPLSANVNIHETLPDEPNDVGGMTAAELKAAWDTPANTLKNYVNNTLIPELDAAHLPYIYGSDATVKQAVENLAAGVVPDDSVTSAMLKAGIVTPAKIAVSALALFAPWKLLQEYKTPGTYTYTVPDGVTQIGVWMVGGGGSGGAGTRVDEGTVYCGAGGGSGYAKHMVVDVTPEQEISVVIGAGGAAVTSCYGAQNHAGNAGGSTSFNGISVSGGSGGGSSYNTPHGGNGGQGALHSGPPVYGCRLMAGSTTDDGEVEPAIEAINPFSAVQPYWLVAGGSLGNTNNVTLPNDNTGSAAVYSATNGAVISGAASTEPGAGGGSATVQSPNANGGESATSAAGAPGAALIYTRSVS